MQPNLSQSRTRPSQDDQLNFIFWNSGGLTEVKSLELQHILYTNKIDAFGIVEAGAVTAEQHIFQPEDFPEYNIKCLPKSRKKGSGILVASKKELTCNASIIKAMNDTPGDTSEIMKMELWKNEEKTTFYIIYNPPGNTPTAIQNLKLDVNTIVIGDFNAHSSKWNYNRTDLIGLMMEEYIDTEGLQLLQSKSHWHTYTHHNGNVTRPDLALVHVSLKHCVTQVNINSPSGRDHDILKITRSLKNKFLPPKQRNSWNFKKGKWDKFRELTNTLLSEDIINDSIENSNKKFIETLHECAFKTIPRGCVKDYKPDWTDELSQLEKQRNEAKSAIASAEDKIKATAHLNKCQATLSKTLLESTRTTFCKFLGELDYRKDGTKAHHFMSKLCGKRQRNPDDETPTLSYKNKELTTNRMKAEAHCEHICNLSKGNKKKLRIRKIKHKKAENSNFDRDFTAAELNSALNKLRNKKSPGIDKVHNEFLKNLGTGAKECLLKLINLSLRNGTPVEWRKAEIIMLLKKGKDPKKVDSYRPIALTSAIAKVAEYMVNERLTNFLEFNKLLSPDQAGFRQHRSTTDQAAAFSQSVKEKLDDGKSTLAVLVDYKAAFDTVWRQMVIQKLQLANAPNNMVRWIKSFLSQRLIRVNINGSKSRFREPRRGVPQGTVTSPMLFNVLINDLPEALKAVPEIKVKMFADDVIIWTSGYDTNDMEITMNKALRILQNWVTENELTVNTSKTTYDFFTLKRTVPDFQLHLGDKKIEHKPNSVYLGITMDPKMTGTGHLENIAQKAQKRLSLLHRVAGTQWGASTQVLTTTYKTYVRPVLEYGAEVFITASDKARASLDKVQNQALRIITGAVKTTPVAAMEQRSGIEPLQKRREKSAVILHEKLIRLDTSWDRNCTAILPTQVSFIEECNKLKKQLLPASIYNAPRESIQPKPPYNIHISVDVRTEIDGINQKKSAYLAPDLKVLTENHIQDHYPPTEWLHIYTDGSATPGKGLAGAGVSCNLFKRALPAGKLGCNYDGEVAAIYAALKELVLNEPLYEMIDKIVILSDCRSALQAISSPQAGNGTVVDIRTLIHGLQECIKKKKTLVLQWVPSHCDLPGNEKADELAKLGATKDQPNNRIPLHTVKTHLSARTRDQIRKAWKTEGRGKNWPPLQTKMEKRSVEVAKFRLDTGHDLLGKHLHRLNITKDDKCKFCKKVLNRSHLFRCGELKNHIDNLPAQMDVHEKEAHLYWLMRKLMA